MERYALTPSGPACATCRIDFRLAQDTVYLIDAIPTRTSIGRRDSSAAARAQDARTPAPYRDRGLARGRYGGRASEGPDLGGRPRCLDRRGFE